MTKRDIEKIKESAEEIVDSFMEITEDIPELEVTYYGQETLNVFRQDGKPTSSKELQNFRKNFLKIMPESDEDGNLEVEIAEWKK